jgi:DNA-binding CsgD family transcriptional regulator
VNNVLQFVFEKMPDGVIVFGGNMDIRCINKRGEFFLRRYKPPEEMESITKRILDAMRSSRLKELFPGEVRFEKKIDGSPNKWVFRFCFSEVPEPMVCIIMTEKTASDRVDINAIRRQYGLTRRETDVLRRVLDGLKNVDIADVLEISEQTVKDHLSNLYMKVGVDNRFGLARLLLNSPEQNSKQ